MSRRGSAPTTTAPGGALAVGAFRPSWRLLFAPQQKTVPVGRTTHACASPIVIATRGHKLDADCMRAAVKTKARYIGLLGSRRKTVLIDEMLRAEGISDERLAAVHAPVGLDLGGRTPAEIAVSVMAEITALRYHGSGKPLSGRNR